MLVCRSVGVSERRNVGVLGYRSVGASVFAFVIAFVFVCVCLRLRLRALKSRS